ncbi:MAG: uroporphyrinogen-III synthase [Rhizomicrobium sp.]|jgi:uroporphyrinogen-III synthase
MRVLVTRPAGDAEETAAQLAALGHQSVIAPLLEIHIHDGPALSLDGVQAIVATSSNGVRAMVQRSERRDLAVFAVGSQTAAVARQCGFANVRSADGDARALGQAVLSWARPQDGALFHPAGSERAGQLAANLTAGGFEVRSAELYQATPAEALPPVAIDALRNGGIDAVLLYSPRTARTFVEHVVGTGLTAALSPIAALCISDATAAALKPLQFREVRVAARPDQASLLALLR